MAIIKEDYCSKEIYRLLIEKGFDGEIHTAFDEEGYTQASITLQMAMKWLREVHKLHCDIDPSEGDWKPNIIELDNWSCVDDGSIPICDTYEEACEVAIKYCLTNLI